MSKKNKKIKLKPSRIIFLIVLIASNTLAWFIYATKIDSNVSVHVKGWNVVFEASENEVTDVVNITVDDLYPGMSNYSYDISAYNNSEVSATITYKILEARILSTTYVTQEGRANNGEPVQAGDLTSSALEYKLSHEYPFTISLSLSGTTLDEEVGKEDFTLSVVWPYESNNDALDTTWGINAYNYKESYPNNPSLTLKVKLIITQDV